MTHDQILWIGVGVAGTLLTLAFAVFGLVRPSDRLDAEMEAYRRSCRDH